MKSCFLKSNYYIQSKIIDLTWLVFKMTTFNFNFSYYLISMLHINNS